MPPTVTRQPRGEDSARPAVATVVVTYNRKGFLRQCLEALQEQTYPVAEIIVVDNASTDGTTAMIQSEFPEVTLHALEENQGGAGGFHEGMKIAASRAVDWIWVMDDDAEPEAKALEMLFEPGVHLDEDTVGLASLRVKPNGEMQRGSAGWFNPFGMSYDRSDPDGPSVECIGYATFVGFMVRERVIHQIGLPVAGYFIRGDDNEYVYRLAQIGEVYLVRESKIVHYDDSGSKTPPTSLLDRFWEEQPVDAYWMQYYQFRNKLLTVRRHAAGPLQQFRGYANGTWILLRKVMAVLLFDSHKHLRIGVLFKAYWDGIRGQEGRRIDPAEFPS